MIEPRADQSTVIAEIAYHLRAGKRAVLLQAPTGSGKSIIGEFTRRAMSVSGWYLCHEKILQEQFALTFPEAAVLKGRVNYPGLVDGCAEDCNWDRQRRWCDRCGEGRDECPYQRALARASSSNQVVGNYDLFFNHHAICSPPTIGRDLIICDEGELYEERLASHWTLTVDLSILAKLKLSIPPRTRAHALKGRAWTDFARQLYNKTWLIARQSGSKVYMDICWKARALKTMENMEENCALDIRDGVLRLGPVKVTTQSGELLHSYPHWLFMSATLLAPEVMARDIGLGDDWAYVEMPNPFPPERRPIYYTPVARVVKADDGATEHQVKQLRRAITSIVLHYRYKTLVHTHTYALAAALAAFPYPYPVLTYDEASGKMDTLHQFRDMKGPAILLAPSMSRGVDMPGHVYNCRNVVICKCPAPDLEDRITAARLYTTDTGRQWYSAQIVRQLTQACGRVQRCFSWDTEVLTVNGWKGPEQVGVGDTVYGVDDSIELRTCPRLIEHKVLEVVHPVGEESTVSILAKGLDALVTADHSMIIQRPKQSRHGGGKYYKWKSNEMSRAEAGSLPARFKVPLAGRVLRDGVRLGAKTGQDWRDWFWLMGMIIADGYMPKEKNLVEIAQSKPHMVRKIDEVVSRLGLEHSRCEGPADSLMSVGAGPVYKRNNAVVHWKFFGYNSARIRDVFFCGERRNYSRKRNYRKKTHFANGYLVDGWKNPEKNIPRWVLKSASRQQLLWLFDGLMDGDGTWNGSSGCYYTKDLDLANRFQELLVLCGMRSRIYHTGSLYNIQVCDTPWVDCVKETSVLLGPVTKVWCLSTEVGSVVVRRGGSTFIAGNSTNCWARVFILDQEFSRLPRAMFPRDFTLQPAGLDPLKKILAG